MIWFVFGMYLGVYIGQEFKDLPNVKDNTVKVYDYFTTKRSTEPEPPKTEESIVYRYVREYFKNDKED